MQVKLSTNSLDKPAEVESTMARAGFTDIHVVAEEKEFVYADEEEWWSVGWSHGARAGRERLEPDVLARYRADIFARLQALKRANAIPSLFSVLYALARKPASPP